MSVTPDRSGGWPAIGQAEAATGVPEISVQYDGLSQFMGYLELGMTPQGLFAACDPPPPAGAAVRLHVLTRRSNMRILAAECRVVSSVGVDSGRAGAVLWIDRIWPGVDEELRRALLPVTTPPAPTADPGPDDLVVGIDLGTTNSCVAVVENGTPRVVASRLGYNTVPSIMVFNEKGEPVIGQAAERRLVTDPGRTAYGTKRFMGRMYSKQLVAQFGKRMVYPIAADSEGYAVAKIDGRTLSPVEVGACILAEMKKVAEQSLNRPVNHACVTVPAYFTEKQRAGVREAGRRAGLNVLRIVNEPTAAALCYGFKRSENKKILVYDLGGGTFDVSVLEISGSLYAVLATAGDTFLGGLDFDNLIVEHALAIIKKDHPQFNPDKGTQERILQACKEAKEALSASKQAEIALPNLRVGPTTSHVADIRIPFTREQLETLAKPLIDRSFTICDQALSAAKLKVTDLGEVLLVGGQTRMPLVQQRVQQKFGRQPSKRVNPDEVVALGAALVAGSRDSTAAPTLIDVLAVPIGIAQPDGGFKTVLRGNTALPADGVVVQQSEPKKPLKLAIYQGEAFAVADCEYLGELTVTDEGAPDGITRAEVTLKLNSEGLLDVEALLPRTGKTQACKLVTQQASSAAVSRAGKGERIVTDTAIKVPVETAQESAGPGALARFGAWLKGLFGKKG